MAKLTEKQKQFLQKHNMWNDQRGKSTLGMFEEGSFKDFFRRMEKVAAELARLPDTKERQDLARKLKEAEEKAKQKDFKEAYNDLKAVKIDARREANGYSGSLSLVALGQRIDLYRQEGIALQDTLSKLATGMKDVRDELNRQGNASDFATVSDAAEFLREFKPTELLLRTTMTGQKKDNTQVLSALRQKDPAKQTDEIYLQLKLLRDEHKEDVEALRQRVELAQVHYIRDGKTVTAADVQQRFDAYVLEMDAAFRRHKDMGKFQSREGSGEKLSDETLMRNPTAWKETLGELDQLLIDLAEGDPKAEFDNVVFALKDLEDALQSEKAKSSPEYQKALQERRDKALRALKLIELRDAKRFRDTEAAVLLDSFTDEYALAQTKDKPKRNQPLATFDADSLVSELTFPPNLKKLKAPEIQKLRQDAKQKMEEILAPELLKPDSDLMFDLALKTKEQFVAELAEAMGLDPSSKKFSKEEKALLDELAEQMLATVREKYPNKAGGGSVKLDTKGGKTTEVPTEFTIGGKKYVNPKYLASGGVGDVLRYQEKDSDPPVYTVIKTLQDTTKRDDMVHELKMHRQANGGEKGANNEHVVEMQGAIVGPKGEIFMALEFADGGDLNDLGYAVAQAGSSGNLSEEARQVVVQHLMRQAIEGMKHVQDNNLTHHDIKGMNYLVGSDGKVKVADFGSGQVGDDQGEVAGNASNMITTPAYKAPELGKATDRVTGKCDTYSLGVMLQKITNPSQGHGPQAQKKEGPVTALDKLTTAMTDRDPNKRPTLEAVLQTAYMNDAESNFDPAAIEELMKALMAYNRHVAAKAKKEMRSIVYNEGELAVLRKQRAAATPDKQKDIDEKIEAKLGEIKDLRGQIDLLMKQDDSKPYVEALQKASAGLSGRGKGPERDLAKVNFKKEYEAIAKASGTPANQKLLLAVTAVDESKDPSAKKKLAGTAAAESEKLAKQLTEFAKSQQSEKAKMVASKLATDLRKLKQVLEQVAEA
jgi:serine/threonine protein kinase